jgi:molybdenum cofactor cytidylyltransferase
MLEPCVIRRRRAQNQHHEHQEGWPDIMTARPVVIVLAAGQGARFAGWQCQPGLSLGVSHVLGTTLRQALASQFRVVVVADASLHELVADHVATKDIVLLPGVGASIGQAMAAGVAACSDASGWLMLPADMPMVEPFTLQQVARHMNLHSIVYAQHHGRRGHPVGFAAELYTELVTLRGDDGVRRLMARYPSLAVEVDDPGVLLDADPGLDAMRARAAVDAKPVAPPQV